MGDAVTLSPPSLADAVMSTSTTAAPDTLIKLCLLWTVLHRTQKAPPACQGVITEQRLLDLQAKGELNDILGSSGIFGLDGVGGAGRVGGTREDDPFRMSPIERFERYNRYSSRSLSVIGVLAGIVLILLIVALSTCIRKRRNLFNESTPAVQRQNRDGFARQIIIDHIRQLRRSSSSASRRGTSAADRPPAYDDVVKPDADGATASAASTSAAVQASPTSLDQPDGDFSHDNDDTVTSCSSRDVFWCERDQRQHQQPPSYLEALQCQAELGSAEASGGHDDVDVRSRRDENAFVNSDSTATFPDTATNEVRLCDFKNETSDSEPEAVKLSQSK